MRNLIQVARATSGARPWVKNPLTPWVALKLERRAEVDWPDPALAIFKARTRSTGYIIVAVQKAAARIAGTTPFVLLGAVCPPDMLKELVEVEVEVGLELELELELEVGNKGEENLYAGCSFELELRLGITAVCGFMAAAAPASEQNRSNEVLMIYVWAFERNLQVYQVRSFGQTTKF